MPVHRPAPLRPSVLRSTVLRPGALLRALLRPGALLRALVRPSALLAALLTAFALPGPAPHRRPRRVHPRPRLRPHGHGRPGPRRPARHAPRPPPRPRPRAWTSPATRATSPGRPCGTAGSVGLHQGDRGHVLHQPVLRPAVQRLLRRRHDPRRLPLRHPGHHRAAPPRPTTSSTTAAAGPATARPCPASLDIEWNPYGDACYGKSAERDGQLDPRLPRTVQGPHRPRRRDLHGHQLVDALHRQLRRLRRRPTRCGSPGTPPPSGTLPAGWSLLHDVAVHVAPGPTVGDHDRFNGALDRRAGARQRLTGPERGPLERQGDRARRRRRGAGSRRARASSRVRAVLTVTQVTAA